MRAVCEVVVRHQDGDFLLVERSFDKKWFPGDWDTGAGGKVEPGERPRDAAARELLEETGIRAQALLPLYQHVSAADGCIFYGYLTCVDIPKDAVVLQERECIAYRWVSAQAFAHFVRFELTGDKPRRLIGALESRGIIEPARRNDDGITAF